jgi:dipeptidyl aminopeptidase/acylaminoacyl peptidase
VAGTGPPPGRVKAIVNYYGPTDLVAGFESKIPFLLNWFKGVDDPLAMARLLSPLTYVRPDAPPILTIQGDADEMVPYQDGLKLRDALTKAHVPNELVTIPGGHHGRFRWTDEDTIRVQRSIEKFLGSYGLVDRTR